MAIKKGLFQGFFKNLKHAFLRYSTQRCALCRCSGRGTVCGFCLRTSQFRAQKNRLRCSACAKPFSQFDLGGAELCAECLKTPPIQNSARTLCDYEYPWSELIVQMKFHRRLDIAYWFGQQLAQYHAAYFEGIGHAGKQSNQAIVVVPIPLSHDKLSQRGFNQSAEIAQRIANTHQFLMCFALEKARQSLQQSDLPKHLRLYNLRGVFVCNQRLDQTQVILVDDVYTTGSTIREAIRVLKKAGATQVHVITVCRTPLC